MAVKKIIPLNFEGKNSLVENIKMKLGGDESVPQSYDEVVDFLTLSSMFPHSVLQFSDDIYLYIK